MNWWIGDKDKAVDSIVVEHFRNWVRSHLLELIRHSEHRAQLEAIPTSALSAAINAINRETLKTLSYENRKIETYLLHFQNNPNAFLKEIL